MRLSIPSAVFALACSGAWAKAPVNGTGALYEPKKFIVQVEKAKLGAAAAKVAARGGTVLKTFDSEVFSGLSIAAEDENVDTLSAIAEVTQAWSSNKIKLAPVIKGQSWSNDAAAANYSVHAYTGVAAAHEAGILGKGAVVAVVDTGTEYTHPALGGGFGPGFKVAGGYDLAGDGEWPYGPKIPDSDPMDTRFGHGTHVAGIIAGNTEWFKGVAPEATLLSYKVFAGDDYTDDATLIEAFLMAYEDGADIISCSVGGPGGFETDAWAKVASSLVDLGVVVIISAGNEGVSGPFFASSGSSGKNVIAVASVDAQAVAAYPFDASFELGGVTNTSQLGYLPTDFIWDLNAEFYALSLDITNPADACEPLPASTPNLSGKIVLIRRGGCNFQVKAANAWEYGAYWILFYDDERPITTPATYIPPDYLTAGMIEKLAGEAIVKTIAAGGKVTAKFTDQGSKMVAVYNSAGGIPSYYTTWGPTYEMALKPDIAAPGGKIFSAYLGGSYAELSGTSMAAPYISGVAALYIGKYGGRSVHGPGFAKMLQDRIISSGAALPYQYFPPESLPYDYGMFAPTPQVGGGQVDAWKVLSYDTSLSWDKFNLNDTHHHSRYQKAVIKNNGAKPITYSFAHQPAAAFNAQGEYPSFLSWIYDTVPFTADAKVTLPKTVTLKPGESKTVQFNFMYPEGLTPSRLPVYSGKVLINGDNGESLSIPYVGAGFDPHDEFRRSMFSDTTPFQVSGVNRDDIEYFNKYDFNLSWYANNFPKVFFELKYGTKELRWDIYEANWKEKNWKYPPVVGENGYVGSATFWSGSGAWAFDENYDNPEDVVAFPVSDIFRSDINYWTKFPFYWLGKLANGTYITPGQYTFRFAVLTPFGNPHASDNWDIWKTPQITVLPFARPIPSK